MELLDPKHEQPYFELGVLGRRVLKKLAEKRAASLVPLALA
jgi:hypothetical protein